MVVDFPRLATRNLAPIRNDKSRYIRFYPEAE